MSQAVGWHVTTLPSLGACKTEFFQKLGGRAGHPIERKKSSVALNISVLLSYFLYNPREMSIAGSSKREDDIKT